MPELQSPENSGPARLKEVVLPSISQTLWHFHEAHGLNHEGIAIDWCLAWKEKKVVVQEGVHHQVLWLHFGTWPTGDAEDGSGVGGVAEGVDLHPTKILAGILMACKSTTPPTPLPSSSSPVGQVPKCNQRT